MMRSFRYGFCHLIQRSCWTLALLLVVLNSVVAQDETVPASEIAEEAPTELVADGALPEAEPNDAAPEATVPEEAPKSEAANEATETTDEPVQTEEADKTEPKANEDKPKPELTWSPNYPKLEKPVSVYVVPIHDAITPPQAYILRRAIKQANELDVEVILLDINTPGGRLDVTLEIMDMLTRFEGTTIAFVNNEAISAGAFISVACDHIYMAPSGTIGAAAAIASTGEDIPATMQQKLNSYLNAKIRSITDEHPMRAEVMRAMMDSSYVLEIDGEVLKAKDELLSLTAKEAMRLFGDPARPLLAEGIYEEVDQLLTTRFGEGMFELKSFEVTWSEELAHWLAIVTPILIGLGIMCFYIEFQTPGFGIFGIIGIVLLLVVFSGSFVAGLAGLEPFLIFFLGIIFLAVEVFLLPGVLIFGVMGIFLILGAILWALVDYWPSTAPSPEGVPDALPSGFSLAMLSGPVQNLALGLVVASVGIYLAWKLLPRTSIYGRLILQTSQGAVENTAIASSDPTATADKAPLPEPGAEGIVLTPLRPMGEIEIGGHRYQAKSLLGYVEKGETVVVRSKSEFALNVEKKA